MFWLACVCCLSAVLGMDFKNHGYSYPAYSQRMSASSKQNMLRALGDKNAFIKHEDSPFDAFCVKEVLEYDVVQQENLGTDVRFHLSIILRGGLGNELIMGKCRDSSLFMRIMEVSAIITFPVFDLSSTTWSFALKDVLITEQEDLAIGKWLDLDPTDVQDLIQQGTLVIDELDSLDYHRIIAKFFPAAPWINRHPILPIEESTSQVNEPHLREEEPSVRVAKPSSQATVLSSQATVPSSQVTVPSSQVTVPSSQVTEPSSQKTVSRLRRFFPRSFSK